MSDDAASAPSDEMVSQFLAITGSADPSNAASYLEMSGGNLETAIGLYMEHQSSSHGGGGGGLTDTGTGGGAADFQSNVGSPGVRAPDETRRMRLMDDVHHHPMMHAPHPMLGIMDDADMMMSSAFGAAGPSAIGAPVDARAAVNLAAASAEQKVDDEDDDDEDDYSNDDDDDDDDVQIMSSTAVPPTLQDMFAPPTHLMHRAGGFQGARAVARDSRRWLLVNLQRDSEFSCHALNRDVWRDELVENLVREGFIFWQEMDTRPDGQTYAQRYTVMEYPHMGIIDPRTGRLMWRKEGWTQETPMTAEAFAEMAMDFCSRHSFDKPPVAPRQHAASASSTNGTSEEAHPSKRQYITEDEQLQAAMRASLKDDNNDDTDSEMADNEDNDVVCLGTDAAAATKSEEPSFVDELVSMDIGDEPSDAGAARIQIRMPDGKRLVRKFQTDAHVKAIYAFVAQSNDEAKSGKEFLLMAGFPPKDLLGDIDNTIESCGLAGEAITVRWK